MERRKDLDFAKGVGIILMVLGHCYSAGNGENILCWLYSFHMPLFFIIPGIIYGVYKRTTVDRLYLIAKRKVKNLMVPYFFFATATAIAFCVIGRKTLSDLGEYMRRIVLLQGINAMWFIPCFLFSELIFIIFSRAKNSWRYITALVAIGFLAVNFPVLKSISSMLQTIVIGVSFIAIGFLCGKIYSKPIKRMTWLICAVIHLGLALLNQCVDLAYGVYGNPLLYYVNGMLGTFVAIHSFAYVSQYRFSEFLVWLGKNTIIVLCTSSFVIEMLRLVDYKLTNSAMPSFGYAEGIILCVLTMMIEVIIILFCKRYLWFVTGKTHTKTL